MINLSTVPDFKILLHGVALPDNRLLDVSKITFQEQSGYTSKLELTIRDSENFLFTFNELRLETPIELQLGWYRGVESLFAGKIVSMAPSFNDNDASEIVIMAYDLSYLLKRPHQLRVNVAHSILGVIRYILNKYQEDFSMEYEISPTDRLNSWKMGDDEGKMQIEDETDYKILSEIAEKISYQLLVRGNTIYFVDQEYFARQQSKTLTFYYRPRARDLEDPEGLVLYRFEPEVRLVDQKTKVRVVSWSSVDQTGVKRGAKALEASSRGKRNFTEVRLETESAVTLTIFGKVAQDAAAAKILAEAELERRARQLVKGQASIKGWPYLRAGQRHRFRIRALGDIGPTFSGEYRITGVEHRLDQSGFRTDFDVESDSLSEVA